MKVEIPFCRWTGKAALEIEVPDDTEKRLRLRVAVEVAVKAGANLTGAYLTDANLTDANLDGWRYVVSYDDGMAKFERVVSDAPKSGYCGLAGKP